MIIEKVFSNVEDPEENLYSVLMGEEELSLFSEIQKEFTSIRKMKKVMKSSEPFFEKARKQLADIDSHIPYSQHKINLAKGFEKLFKGREMAAKNPEARTKMIKTYNKIRPKATAAFREGSDIILKPNAMKDLRKKGINPIGI